MVARGYKNATEDRRGLFSRFLPTTWRDLETGRRDAHNGIVGAIQDSLGEQEQWSINSRRESWLETASGKFLDKWGKIIGVSRRTSELDDTYRGRIHDYIIAKRGTIRAIVDAVNREFEDDELEVWIYEPWRNIFYLNSSLLNGTDYLQGFYYRYADINIHISKPVDQDRLSDVVDHYKDAGVMVYYTYEPGLMADAPMYSLSLDPVGEWLDVSVENGAGKYMTYEYTLGQANPNQDIEGDEFITNKSELNSLDYLSGNPYSGKSSYNFAIQNSMIDPDTSWEMSEYTKYGMPFPDDVYKLTNAKDGLFGHVTSNLDSYSVSELTTLFLSTILFKVGADGALKVSYTNTPVSEKYQPFMTMLQGTVQYKLDSNTGILAYYAWTDDNLSNSPTVAFLNDVLTQVNFGINYQSGMASFTPEVGDNDLRLLNMYPYLLFDFSQWYMNNRGDLDESDNTSTRYIRFNNYGSAYGFNIKDVSILTENQIELSSRAKWIYLNGGPISGGQETSKSLDYPTVSTGSWVLDLGDVYDVKSITVSDSYVGGNRRDVSISEDGQQWYTVHKTSDTSTGVISLDSYATTSDKGKWISSHILESNLHMVIRNNETATSYLEAYNFVTKRWDLLSAFSGNNFNVYDVDSLELDKYISSTGILVFRIENTIRGNTDMPQVDLDIDYYGFMLTTQEQLPIPDYGMSVSMERTTV